MLMCLRLSDYVLTAYCAALAGAPASQPASTFQLVTGGIGIGEEKKKMHK